MRIKELIQIKEQLLAHTKSLDHNMISGTSGHLPLHCWLLGAGTLPYCLIPSTLHSAWHVVGAH